MVCVRPEPSRGRSDAISSFPLAFTIAEHDDAGSGVALLRAIALIAATRATIAISADAPAPTYMRFFTRPPVWGVRGIPGEHRRDGVRAANAALISALRFGRIASYGQSTGVVTLDRAGPARLTAPCAHGASGV